MLRRAQAPRECYRFGKECSAGKWWWALAVGMLDLTDHIIAGDDSIGDGEGFWRYR